jgi:hypothetical protein
MRYDSRGSRFPLHRDELTNHGDLPSFGQEAEASKVVMAVDTREGASVRRRRKRSLFHRLKRRGGKLLVPAVLWLVTVLLIVWLWKQFS